ncbi:MAG: hypothetical protein HY319_16800 [Armatimonadetes bacterium]|nr:hypothetical protein [Armatimonadota bacterium]
MQVLHGVKDIQRIELEVVPPSQKSLPTRWSPSHVSERADDLRDPTESYTPGPASAAPRPVPAPVARPSIEPTEEVPKTLMSQETSPADAAAPVDWGAEYLSILKEYSRVDQDPARTETAEVNPEPLWQAILKTRQRVLEKFGVLGSRDRLESHEAAATLGFVRALCESWDKAFMRADGLWKARVADAVAAAFRHGIDIVGTSEWDRDLDAMVTARGLAVSSSSRVVRGEDWDGNAVIYDPRNYRCVKAGKHVFSSTMSGAEKVWHEAWLEHLESGEVLYVQSAHLEKNPEDRERNAIREQQMAELGAAARAAAEHKETTAILLADTNSEAALTVGGHTVANPVDSLLRQNYQHVHRPEKATAVTAQRSMSIDVVAGRCPPASSVGPDVERRLGDLEAAMEPLLPAGTDNVLPNASNPSDHTWAVGAVPTPSGGVLAGTWNVLSGRYRNPLKGNLFYPLAFLFDPGYPADREALGQIRDVWGEFYTAAKTIPGWQLDGVPFEQSFMQEYLIGPPLQRLSEIRRTIDQIVERWGAAEREAFERARAEHPQRYQSHDGYRFAPEASYLITHQREALLAALRRQRTE